SLSDGQSAVVQQADFGMHFFPQRFLLAGQQGHDFGMHVLPHAFFAPLQHVFERGIHFLPQRFLPRPHDTLAAPASPTALTPGRSAMLPASTRPITPRRVLMVRVRRSNRILSMWFSFD